MIVIGNDHAGVELKNIIKKELAKRKIDFIDLGTAADVPVDYPLIAERICEQVVAGNADKAVIICGTGIGVSITANKLKGIRAVACSDPYSAEMSRRHNDTNVLCMGGRVVGPGLAIKILNAWLNAEFEGGRHENRVNIIKEMEDRRFK